MFLFVLNSEFVSVQFFFVNLTAYHYLVYNGSDSVYQKFDKDAGRLY